MTLYEALDAFKTIRDTAISTESKRRVADISQDWQSINTNMTMYYNTVSSGDTTSANAYIDEIITILAGYDLTVDLPVQFPLSLSVFASPSTIQVPVDVNGLNPDYTNALSIISVYIGGVDDSDNWSYAVASSSNVTAAIQNTNEVKVSAITANSGSVTINISKTGYTTIQFFISVNRGYAGVNGGVFEKDSNDNIVASDNGNTVSGSNNILLSKNSVSLDDNSVIIGTGGISLSNGSVVLQTSDSVSIAERTFLMQGTSTNGAPITLYSVGDLPTFDINQMFSGTLDIIGSRFGLTNFFKEKRVLLMSSSTVSQNTVLSDYSASATITATIGVSVTSGRISITITPGGAYAGDYTWNAVLRGITINT